MAIIREVQYEEKLVPTEIRFYGDSMCDGLGTITIKQEWRRANGKLDPDHERSYRIEEELQNTTLYAGITTMQVFEFLTAYFEAKEYAAQAANEAGRLAEEARLAAEAAAQNG